MPIGVSVTLAVVLGLVVGSFLNVVIYRVPRAESIATPGSHCPRCGRPIRAMNNVPVVSWLVLRGRCADCGAPISMRYPAVELAAGASFGLLTGWADTQHQLAAAPAWCYLAAVGIALALIDLDVQRLPNVIVLPSYGVLAALLVFAALADDGLDDLLRAFLGALVLGACYLVIVLVYPAGMGWGDVKLAGLLGMAMAYVSWSALLIGGFAGFALGAVVGVVVIASGRGTRSTRLPFGPFMIVGVFLGILVGNGVADWYLTLIR